MNVIENEVKAAIDKELAAATEEFGPHHSNHEKMAVIVEEYEECAEAVENMRQMIQMAWGRTRDDQDIYSMNMAYELIYQNAVDVAIEACQVAAMATKQIGKNGQARWLVSSDGYYPYCSNCGARPATMTKYCAECGCEMRKEVNT